MNPSAIAKQQRGEELEKLRKENESLRRRLQLLEEGGCSPEDASLLSKVSRNAGRHSYSLGVVRSTLLCRSDVFKSSL